ncbi:MAG: PAS domain-containing protein, partial [Planctomycetia bacterium]
AALVLIAANGWSTARSLNVLAENDHKVAKTHQVLTQIETVLSTLVDAESNQRAYVLTGEAEFLDPYDDAVATIDRQVWELQQLTADDADQQERVSVLRASIDENLAEMRRTIARRQAGETRPAVDDAFSGDGRRRMDDVRMVANRMETEERRRLAERNDASSEARTAETWSLALSTATAVGMTALVFYFGLSYFRERRRAADTAVEQLERYRTTLGSIGDAVIGTDVDGRVSFLNPEAERLTGWTGDAVGKRLAEVFVILDEGTRSPIESPVARVLREGAVVGLANHTVLVGRNGVERSIADSAAPIRGADGRLFGVVLVFQDVTERRRAERELAASEERLRRQAAELDAALREKTEGLALLDALFQNAPVGLAYYDVDCRFVRVNESMAAINGLPVEAHLGRPVAELLPELWPTLEPLFRRVLDRGESLSGWEVVGETPSEPGRRRSWTVGYYPVREAAGRVVGMGVAVLEVTERREAEDRIRRFNDELEVLVAERTAQLEREAEGRRRSEVAQTRLAERLALLLESTDEGLAGIDAEGRFTFINRHGAEMLGWRPEELVGRRMHDVCHHGRHDDLLHPPGDCPILYATREGKGRRVRDETYWRKDGTSFPVEYASHPMIECGVVKGAVVTFTDVSDRVAAEAALRESERYVRSILDNSPDCIKVLDLQGRLVEMNGPGRCVLEIEDFGPLRGCDWAGLWPEPQRPVVRASVAAALAGGLGRFQAWCPTTSGNWKFWDVQVAPIPGPDGRPARLVSVSRDVSPQKRSERRLEVQYVVAQVLAEAVDDPLPRLLEEVCTKLEWDRGEFWATSVDDPTVLHCQAEWQADPAAFPLFRETTRDFRFAKGVGLPGRAWE